MKFICDSTQMHITYDHIRLWNEGVLPEDYTVETLMSKHSSKPRNPKMAQVFYRAGFIEAWGRGYEKIKREFNKANLACPTFTVEQGGVTAIIPREVFLSIRGDKKPPQTNTDRTKTEPKPNQNRAEESDYRLDKDEHPNYKNRVSFSTGFA